MQVSTRSSSLPIVLFTLVFFLVWLLRATFFYTIDETISSDSLRTLYSNLVKFFLWVVPAFGFSYWIRRANPLKYLGFSTMPSVRKWLISMLILGVFIGTITSFEILANGKTLTLNTLLPFTFADFVFSFISPLTEEILFRGLLLKEFSGFMSGWKANLLTSLLFAGIHLPFWLTHIGLTSGVIANTAGVFIFSLIAGWLYLRTSSLWPPYLAHVINNLIAGMLVVAG